MHCTLRHKLNRKITHRVCKPLQTRCAIAVGYLNKTTIEGNNYITPTFTAVDGGDMSIRGVQMDATVGDLQANFQRLDYEAGSACYYAWYNTCISAQVLYPTIFAEVTSATATPAATAAAANMSFFIFVFLFLDSVFLFNRHRVTCSKSR